MARLGDVVNKRMLLAGFIVLAISIALWGISAQIIGSSYSSSPPLASREFSVGSLIFSYLFGFAGFILIIYGFISKDPPIHWNNNL
jgi:hypothetical protein